MCVITDYSVPNRAQGHKYKSQVTCFPTPQNEEWRYPGAKKPLSSVSNSSAQSYSRYRWAFVNSKYTFDGLLLLFECKSEDLGSF